MPSSTRSIVAKYVAGAFVAGLLAFSSPVAAFAQEAPASETTATEATPEAPRGFIAQPASPVNVGNPAATTGPEQRIALVIGNSNYRSVAALPNPANDARSVSQLLNQAGFEVIQATDLGHDEMIQVLRSFSAKIADRGPNTVAMVYYAGHGVQVAGDNYLIPVDAKISSEGDLPATGIRLVDVMATLQAVPSRMRIVVVDACRNNPFKTLGEATRGLAIVDAPNGSIVGYSTAPGTEALDGQGANSPYTAAFLKLARQPNVPIEQFFKNVRLEVNQETAGRQTPWESSSLTSNFTFFGDTVQVASQQPVREVYSTANLQTRGAREGYRYAMATDSVQAYQDYIVLYPTDPYCFHIRRLLAAKLLAIAWHHAVVVNSPIAYKTFYSQYPTSPYANLALKLQAKPKILPLYQTTNNFAPANFASQVKFTHLKQIGLNGQGNQGLGNQGLGNGIGNGQGLGNGGGQGGLGGGLGNVLGNKGGSPINPTNGTNPTLGIKPIVPGVDLAKGGRPDIKVDSVLTKDRVTTLPGQGVKPLGTGVLGNDKRVTTGIAGGQNGLGDKLKPGVSNANGSAGGRVLLDRTGNSGINTIRTNNNVKLINPANGNGNGNVNGLGNGQNLRPVSKLASPNTMVMKTSNPPAQVHQPMVGRTGGGGSSSGGMMMRSFR